MYIKVSSVLFKILLRLQLGNLQPLLETLAVKDYLDGLADEYQRKCCDGELGKCSSKPKEIILHFFGGFYIFCLVV